MRIVRDIAIILVLVLAQAFLFNELFFLRFLNPYLYVYVVFSILIRYPRAWQLIMAFAIGGSLDLLEGSAGLHAGATLFIAFIQPIVKGFWSVGQEDPDEEPSLKNMSLDRRLGFLFTAFFLHHFVLFSLEQFGFENFVDLLKQTFFSSLFSFTFVVLYQLWNARR
ncbi:MAG: hypothetical protein NXI09_11125 [Bacteroidetes bacterium]|nr:hypothetical protein [Bacteroidota bacterium]